MLEIKKIVTNLLRNGTAYTTIFLVLRISSPAASDPSTLVYDPFRL